MTSSKLNAEMPTPGFGVPTHPSCPGAVNPVYDPTNATLDMMVGAGGGGAGVMGVVVRRSWRYGGGWRRRGGGGWLEELEELVAVLWWSEGPREVWLLAFLDILRRLRFVHFFRICQDIYKNTGDASR